MTKCALRNSACVVRAVLAPKSDYAMCAATFHGWTYAVKNGQLFWRQNGGSLLSASSHFNRVVCKRMWVSLSVVCKFWRQKGLPWLVNIGGYGSLSKSRIQTLARTHSHAHTPLVKLEKLRNQRGNVRAASECSVLRKCYARERERAEEQEKVKVTERQMNAAES